MLYALPTEIEQGTQKSLCCCYNLTEDFPYLILCCITPPSSPANLIKARQHAARYGRPSWICWWPLVIQIARCGNTSRLTCSMWQKQMGQTGKGLFISLPWYLRCNLISCARPEVSCQARDYGVWCDWKERRKKSLFSSWTQAEDPSQRTSLKISDLRKWGGEIIVWKMSKYLFIFSFFQGCVSAFLSAPISSVWKGWPVTGNERRRARLHWMLRPRGTKKATP